MSDNLYSHGDTIAAIATAPGIGGVGIVRVSGPKAPTIAKTFLERTPKPRYAELTSVKDKDGNTLDLGLCLFFNEPNSFTGEDVFEFQGHGGPYVLDSVLKRVCELGARMARPGEFSERAFLNNKIDLVQAEAIADLIESKSQKAANAAIKSLTGHFSIEISNCVNDLTELRMYVEAALDFPEEEVDFLSDGKIEKRLNEILATVEVIESKSRGGVILKEGLNVVLTGPPNAGKSTLLNQLSQRQSAIVTDIPGTTRDVIKEEIMIDSLPLFISDTAGLRDATDSIELEGIKRAKDEIKKAQCVLLMVDYKDDYHKELEALRELYPNLENSNCDIIIIRNKSDLAGVTPSAVLEKGRDIISLSAKAGDGVSLLKDLLKEKAGLVDSQDGIYSARRRHLVAIEKAKDALLTGHQQLTKNKSGELLAQELKEAQMALGQITGEFTSDDLLGKIFSSFCIGK